MDIDNISKLKEIWDAIPQEDSKQSSLAFAKFWASVDKKDNRSRSPLRKAARIYSYCAAALFLPLIVGLVIYFSEDRTPAAEYAEFVVPQGQRDSVRLADNTLVWLNAGSRLIYPEEFHSAVRKVYLSGEAFFEVEKNPEKPFIVSAGEVSVRVLGTKFNLSAYEDSKSVYVSLLEGSVKMETEHKGVPANIPMSPGDVVRFDRSNGELARTSGSAYAMADWRDGGLYFHDRTLSEIISSLERTFDVRISLSDSSVGKERYSLAFVNNETLDQIITAIAYNGKLTAVKTGDGYSLSRR